MISLKELAGNDRARAKLFAQRVDGRFCLIPGVGYIKFDGQVWARLSGNSACGFYADIMEGLAVDISKTSEEQAEECRNVMLSIGKARATLAMCEDQPGMCVPYDEWQEAPGYMCVKNGVVNLQTGHLMAFPQPFSRNNRSRIQNLHLLSKLDVNYRDDAAPPEAWCEFLREAFGNDDEVAEIVQRACGYSLTGYTSEHMLFFLYGPGGTGKSTFVNVLRRVSGSGYATVSPARLVVSSWRQQESVNSPHVADLIGKRLSWVEEISLGHYWDDASLKRLVSDDQLTASAKFKAPVTFTPTHKLWIIGNVPPVLKVVDTAMMRRLMLIDMTHSFLGKARVRDYAGQLWRRESEGILRWMVDGAKAWFAKGLGEWSETRLGNNLQTYSAESNNIPLFCARAFSLDEPDGEGVLFAQALAAYKRWCRDQGDAAQRMKVFYAYLRSEYAGHFCDTDQRGNMLKSLKMDFHGMSNAERPNK